MIIHQRDSTQISIILKQWKLQISIELIGINKSIKPLCVSLEIVDVFIIQALDCCWDSWNNYKTFQRVSICSLKKLLLSHKIKTHRKALGKNLSITTILCGLSIATHDEKMQMSIIVIVIYLKITTKNLWLITTMTYLGNFVIRYNEQTTKDNWNEQAFF